MSKLDIYITEPAKAQAENDAVYFIFREYQLDAAKVFHDKYLDGIKDAFGFATTMKDLEQIKDYYLIMLQNKGEPVASIGINYIKTYYKTLCKQLNIQPEWVDLVTERSPTPGVDIGK